MTIKQTIRNRLPRFTQKNKHSALEACPQKKGLCLKVYSINPKKPNSAERKVAKVRLTTGKLVTCYVPGEKHALQEHALVLVRGGRVKDLPGVHYQLIRGVFDLNPVILRKTSRSKYGKKLTN